MTPDTREEVRGNAKELSRHTYRSFPCARLPSCLVEFMFLCSIRCYQSRTNVLFALLSRTFHTLLV